MFPYGLTNWVVEYAEASYKQERIFQKTKNFPKNILELEVVVLKISILEVV